MRSRRRRLGVSEVRAENGYYPELWPLFSASWRCVGIKANLLRLSPKWTAGRWDTGVASSWPIVGCASQKADDAVAVSRARRRFDRRSSVATAECQFGGEAATP